MPEYKNVIIISKYISNQGNVVFNFLIVHTDWFFLIWTQKVIDFLIWKYYRIFQELLLKLSTYFSINKIKETFDPKSTYASSQIKPLKLLQSYLKLAADT